MGKSRDRTLFRINVITETDVLTIDAAGLTEIVARDMSNSRERRIHPRREVKGCGL
jgi:hypothetical protein